MQLPLVLLLAAGGAASSLPRGVGPDFAAHYAGPKFACIRDAASRALTLDQVNDNTCDCPDGSDEPGTSACAHLDPLSPPQPLAGSPSGTTNTTHALPGFWCENAGHVSGYVPFAWVNDGVCDYDVCCDGSEEHGGAGGARCENRCAAIGEEHRRLRKERRQAAERSGRARAALARTAGDMRGRIEAEVGGLRGEIQALEARAADLQQKYEEIQRHERGRMAGSGGGGGGGGGGGKLGVLLGLAKTRVGELRAALASVVDQRDDLADRVAQLEQVLAKFKDEYNPNFNDEGVKAAVKAWEDYAAKQLAEPKTPQAAEEDVAAALGEDSEQNGINWAEFGEEHTATDTDILYTLEAYLPPFLRSYMHSRINAFRVWLIKNGMLADAPAGAESRLVAAAREEHEAATRDVTAKKSALADKERDLARDYGVDDVFRALDGKCVSTDAGEYTYELCWLDRTAQKPRRGGATTNMGKFERIDFEVADEEDRPDGRGLGSGLRMVLRYEHGTGCWNGPQRRTDVWLACSETEELWRVTEAEKCVYRMEVGTPAACDRPPKSRVENSESAAAGKDEL